MTDASRTTLADSRSKQLAGQQHQTFWSLQQHQRRTFGQSKTLAYFDRNHDPTSISHNYRVCPIDLFVVPLQTKRWDRPEVRPNGIASLDSVAFA